jgi:hypothetical protein
MDQIPAPGPSKLFHVRMVASLLFFLFWDTVSTYICLSTLILDKESLKKGTALGGLGGSSILFTAEVSQTVKTLGEDLADLLLPVSPQFAITLARGLTVTSRYIINLVDLWRARGREDAPVWEGKSMCVSLVELVHGRSTSYNPKHDPRTLTRNTFRCSPTGHLCRLLLHHLLPIRLNSSQPHTLALLGLPFIHGEAA